MTRRSAALLGAVLALFILGLVSWLASGRIVSTGWLERAYYCSQVLTLPVALTAAILVYRQVAQIQGTLTRADFDSTSARISHLSDLLLNHPVEYAQLQSNQTGGTAGLLAEALLDVMDTELLRRRVMQDVTGPGLPALVSYFADLLAEIPGLRSVLELRRGWYSSELSALARTSDEGTSVAK